jgi:type I restriction enzyme, S subunit
MSWEMAKFTDVVQDITGGNQKFQSSEYLLFGKHPIIDQGETFIGGYTNAKALVSRAKDVVVFGDHTKVLKYVDFDFCLGADGVKVLQPVEGLDTKFLYYYLGTVNLPDVGYSRHYKFLKEIQIPLPPLPVQKRITEILDAADALKRKDQELLKKYDELAQAIFIDMFGDPVKNEKGWKIGIIRDLAIEVKYGTSKPSDDNGLIPYLRMNNITYSGDWDITNLKYINLDGNEYEKYIVNNGDLIFNRTNSKELVGKTAVFNLNQEMAIAGYLIKLRTNSFGNPYYISSYLNSKHGKKTLFGMCKSIVGMANINAQELQEIKIMIPPIDLQNQFEERYNQIKKIKSKSEKQIISSSNLFNTLIQKAFKGELAK